MFMGAYFELQVFAMLRRLNCCVDIHPRFSGTEGTVDFRVTYGQDRFYVEATVCGINQGILRSSSNEEDAVRKIKNAFNEPHSDVWLHATGELRRTLGKHRLVHPIKDLLRSYDADDVRRLEGESPWAPWARPQTSISESGWRLDVHLRPPIASSGRGQIWGPSRVGPVDGSSTLAKALSKKAEDWKKKGLEQENFLIAVNVCHSDFSWYASDAIDIMRALYCDLKEQRCGSEFRRDLRHVTGIIAFNNGVLGKEIDTTVRIFRNGKANIPNCLHFLLEEGKFGSLIGMST